MLPAGENTLPKEERLCGKTAISSLMSKGRWGKCGVLRYCWKEGNSLTFNRIMVSVPKKNFKRAVKRNLLKRRIRESYRLQKEMLSPALGVDVLFFYNSTEIAESSAIKADVAAVLQEVSGKAAAK